MNSELKTYFKIANNFDNVTYCTFDEADYAFPECSDEDSSQTGDSGLGKTFDDFAMADDSDDESASFEDALAQVQELLNIGSIFHET
jgi:hypothetical protein